MIKAAVMVVLFALPGGELREHREKAPSLEVCVRAAQTSKTEIEESLKAHAVPLEKLVLRFRCVPTIEVS